MVRMDREGLMGGRRVSRGGTGEERRMTGVGEQWGDIHWSCT